MYKSSYLKITLGLFLLLMVGRLNSFSQITKIKGHIYSAETGESIPYASVAVPGKSRGTITDEQGQFLYETSYPLDSLLISCVGFIPRYVKIKRNVYQQIKIPMEKNLVALAELIIIPGESMSHPILKKVSENKEKNRLHKNVSYNCNVYNKLQLDLNDFEEEFKDKKVFNQFQFVFENIDTSTLTGKPYLPLLLSEAYSEFHYNADKNEEREVILGSKISGKPNESLSQFAGKMYLDVDFYDNYVNFFEPGFVSPIADFGRLFYRYYLIDSTIVDDPTTPINKFYKISFRPRRKMERTFSGYMVISAYDFALQKLELRISPDANINYIRDLSYIIEYQYLKEDSVWFVQHEHMVVDFQLTNKTTGFFARKNTTYSNVYLIPDHQLETIKSIKSNIHIKDGANEKEEDYWLNVRPTSLTTREKRIYETADSVLEVPIFKKFQDVVELLFTTYWVKGKFEYGPYYSIYSFNELEGSRFRFGGRTSNEFSTKLMFNGYLAYGLKDNTFKFELGYIYMHSKNPRRASGISYNYDYRQLAQSEYSTVKDNFITSIFRREPDNKLNLVREFKAYYEHEWFMGFSSTVILKNKIFYPTHIIPFREISELDDTTHFSQITSSEMILHTRFAKDEQFLMGEFERVSLGTKSPIFELYLTFGFKDILNSDYNYFRIYGSISDKLEINPIGYTRYQLEAGKIFGTLPFPLLEIHKGNETYANDPTAFNMMNYYEFISDEYVSLFAEHHFQGFFLNRIPLLRKLEWREIIGTRSIVGSISDKNYGQVYLFPLAMTHKLKYPYVEANIGIENILKVIRVDMLWRFNYITDNSRRMGIRVKFQLIL